MPEIAAGDTRALLAAVSLQRIDLYKLHAVSAAGFDLDGLPEAPEDGSANINVTQSIRIRPNGLDIRCALDVRALHLHIEVDIAAAYDCREGDTLVVEGPATAEFAEKVGMMALWPYARQHVADLSSRLTSGPPFVLPVVQSCFFHQEPTNVVKTQMSPPDEFASD